MRFMEVHRRLSPVMKTDELLSLVKARLSRNGRRVCDGGEEGGAEGSEEDPGLTGWRPEATGRTNTDRAESPGLQKNGEKL